MSKNSEKVIAWRKRAKELIVHSMGGCCQICSYNKTNKALELHHIESSEKEMAFSKIRANPQSYETIKNELKKCILLCANCHREVHDNITLIPETFHTFDESMFEIMRQEHKQRMSRKGIKLNKAPKA